MARLEGKGVLVVWLDLDEFRRSELDCWYVEEHFPERIRELGYARARRYRATAGGPGYMSVMEAATPAALVNDGYRRVTANPSDRTKRMRGAFKRAIRSTYEVAASHSHADAATMACIQLRFAGDPERSRYAAWAHDSLADWMRSKPAVLAAHALVPSPAIRQEMDLLRPTGQNDEWADGLLLLEFGREADLDVGMRQALRVDAFKALGVPAQDTSIWTYQLMFGVGGCA